MKPTTLLSLLRTNNYYFSPEGTKSVSLDVSRLMPHLVSRLMLLAHSKVFTQYNNIFHKNYLRHGYLFDFYLKSIKSISLEMLDKCVSLQPAPYLSSETLLNMM